MIWKPNKPIECDVRILEKFAYLPVDLSDGRRVWWAWYYVKERFEKRGYNEDYFWQQKENAERPAGTKVPHILGPYWGSFVGGAFWNEQGKYATPDEIPVSAWDNYFRTHPNERP